MLALNVKLEKRVRRKRFILHERTEKVIGSEKSSWIELDSQELRLNKILEEQRILL